MHRTFRTILKICEIVFSAALFLFFSIQIVQLVITPKTQALTPQVNNSIVYLEGKVLNTNGTFQNLLLLVFNSFTGQNPAWTHSALAEALRPRSLILAPYEASEVNQALLACRIPYWENDAVRVSIAVDGEWHELDELLEFFPPHPSLEEIVFSGMGMDTVNLQDVTPAEFFDAYFHGKHFRVTTGLFKKGENVRVRIQTK